LQEQERERRRFDREHFWRTWKEWMGMDVTHKAVVPVAALVVLSGFFGWSLGASNTTCPTFLVPPQQTSLR